VADESARLVIQTDTDDVLQAAAEVERLRRALEAARDSVQRAAPGWEMQARGISSLAAELSKAETAYGKMERAARRASDGADFSRAGKMSMMGFNLANTLQDAAYNPAYAINNVMFMAQQSGGVKALGQDLKEFTVIAAAAAAGGIKSLPSLIAGASGAAVAGGVALTGLGGAALLVNRGLKDAGLTWADFTAVLANTTPIKSAGEALSSLGEAFAESSLGVTLKNMTQDMTVLVNMAADYALNWNAVTDSIKQAKDATAQNAANAMQAGRTSGFIRGDLLSELTGGDAAGVLERLNRAFAAGRLTEEDYAATLERVNAAQLAAQKQQGEAALRAQAAETDLAAARINESEAIRKAAEASRNAAEAASLEAEQKAKLRQFDQRVDRRADLYGGAFGGGVAQAMLRAAQRGEDAGAVDDRLRGQLMARMQNVAPGMREAVANQILQRSRMMAEDQAVMMGFQGDVMGSHLASVGGRGAMGAAARQQAARMGAMMGIDVDAYGKAMGAASPTEKQLDAAKTMQNAVREFKDVIRNVQVTI
jgi:hypothetical protein